MTYATQLDILQRLCRVLGLQLWCGALGWWTVDPGSARKSYVHGSHVSLLSELMETAEPEALEKLRASRFGQEGVV